MPSEITWLPGTSRDVARLRNFIKFENPRAAQRAAKRIVEGVNIQQETQELVCQWKTLSIAET